MKGRFLQGASPGVIRVVLALIMGLGLILALAVIFILVLTLAPVEAAPGLCAPAGAATPTAGYLRDP